MKSQDGAARGAVNTERGETTLTRQNAFDDDNNASSLGAPTDTYDSTTVDNSSASCSASKASQRPLSPAPPDCPFDIYLQQATPTEQTLLIQLPDLDCLRPPPDGPLEITIFQGPIQVSVKMSIKPRSEKGFGFTVAGGRENYQPFHVASVTEGRSSFFSLPFFYLPCFLFINPYEV